MISLSAAESAFIARVVLSPGHHKNTVARRSARGKCCWLCLSTHVVEKFGWAGGDTRTKSTRLPKWVPTNILAGCRCAACVLLRTNILPALVTRGVRVSNAEDAPKVFVCEKMVQAHLVYFGLVSTTDVRERRHPFVAAFTPRLYTPHSTADHST